MTFEIEINGRTCTVAIEQTVAGRFRVSVDGRSRELDAARTGSYGLSLIDSPSGTSHDVQVTPGTRPDERLVSLRGRTVGVMLNGRRSRHGAADATGAADGEQAVTAPMPGRVVRLLVGAGDDVTVRQGLVVVEAMKMENELRSPKAGRVKEVSVTAGASVEAGRVLLVIE
jgi:biotin carboxyl carrier protein